MPLASRLRGVLGLLVLVAIGPRALHAQPSVDLDSVLVTASPFNSTAAVTRITAADIEAENAAVAYDVLEYQPGLHVVQRLALTGAGLTRLAVRGSGVEGPSGLTVYLDGRPDPTVTFVHPAPQAHEVTDIESIEVIFGPSPVLYGSGNTGVVNIRLRDPGRGVTGALTASGGSFGTSETFATAGYGAEQGFVSVSGTYRRSGGYLTDSTDAWIAGGHVRAAYDLSDRVRIRAGAAQTRDHFAVFGPFSVPGPFGNPGTTDLDLTQTVGHVTLEGDAGGVAGSAMVWGDRLTPRSQVLPAGAEVADVSEVGTRLRAAAAPWDGGRLTVGLDVLRAHARNTPALPPKATEQDVTTTEAGPYVFVEQDVSSYLLVNGGVRLSVHSEYGAEPGAEVGLLVRPGGADPASPLRGTRLHARLSRGYQAPALQQLFGVFRGTVTGPANPELRPETVVQIEGGIRQQLPGVTLRVTGFLQDGSDLIVPVMGELQNAGDFSRYGVEAGVQVRPSRQFLFDIGVTAYDLEETVLRIPRTTLDVMAMVRPDWLTDVGLRVYGRYAADTNNRAGAPNSPLVALDDYFVLNAKLGVGLAQFGLPVGTKVFLEVDNLTDEDYQTVLDLPMPGRAVYAGATLRF